MKLDVDMHHPSFTCEATSQFQGYPVLLRRARRVTSVYDDCTFLVPEQAGVPAERLKLAM